MTYTITKRFEFSASHQLGGLPEDHPCSRLHGHNYTVEVELESDELDHVGMVYDYRRLDLFKQWLDDTVDHRHLNDVVPFNPTAEQLAEWLYEMFTDLLDLAAVRAVRVCETPKTMAEYRP